MTEQRERLQSEQPARITEIDPVPAGESVPVKDPDVGPAVQQPAPPFGRRAEDALDLQENRSPKPRESRRTELVLFALLVLFTLAWLVVFLLMRHRS